MNAMDYKNSTVLLAVLTFLLSNWEFRRRGTGKNCLHHHFIIVIIIKQQSLTQMFNKPLVIHFHRRVSVRLKTIIIV